MGIQNTSKPTSKLSKKLTTIHSKVEAAAHIRCISIDGHKRQWFELCMDSTVGGRDHSWTELEVHLQMRLAVLHDGERRNTTMDASRTNKHDGGWNQNSSARHSTSMDRGSIGCLADGNKIRCRMDYGGDVWEARGDRWN